MVNEKVQKVQTMIYKTLHGKLKTGGELMCRGRVGGSSSTCDTRRITWFVYILCK